MKLRAQATLSTRPAKHVHSLAELTAAWPERAERVLGEFVTTLMSAVSTQPVLRAQVIPREVMVTAILTEGPLEPPATLTPITF